MGKAAQEGLITISEKDFACSSMAAILLQIQIQFMLIGLECLN